MARQQNRKEVRPKTRLSEVEKGDSRRPLLPYLKGILGSLNPTERMIANCVLADPEKVITSPIAELSARCSASVGSIVTFCRRVGTDGFAEFKIALARDLAKSGLPAGLAEQNSWILEKVCQFHSQSLMEVPQINSKNTFERVAQVLERARRIEIFSIGLSYPVAHTAFAKFMLLGLPASAQADPHLQLITATQLRKGDVAVGISCSGTTSETVQCLEVAKAKEATTICLTNAMDSPITSCADLALYATPGEINYFQAPLASRITQLAVIDALFVYLALKSQNKTAARLQQSGEALLKRRLR